MTTQHGRLDDRTFGNEPHVDDCTCSTVRVDPACSGYRRRLRAEQAPVSVSPISRGRPGEWQWPHVQIIPDLFTPRPYIKRFVVFRTPWGGVYVHKILLDDGDRDPHNHPRSFVSIILRGGYAERVSTRWGPARLRRWGAGSVHRLRLGQFHKITDVWRVPTWTLLLVGSTKGRWGFLTPLGYVDSDDYQEHVKRLRGIA